jgi:hypothetical protein
MLLMLVSAMPCVADGFGETVAMLIENQKSFHAGWARLALRREPEQIPFPHRKPASHATPSLTTAPC